MRNAKLSIIVLLGLVCLPPSLAQPMNVDGYLKQARAFVDLRRYNEAESAYTNAKIQAEKLGPRNPTLISVLDEVANFYIAQGNWGKAETSFRRELDLRTSLSGSQCPEVAQCKKQMAEMYISEGIYGEAESLLQDSIQYWQDSVDRNRDPRANNTKDRLAIADCLDDLARVYRQTGRADGAKELERRSLNIRSNPADLQ